MNYKLYIVLGDYKKEKFKGNGTETEVYTLYHNNKQREAKEKKE